jgi:hypothetical protein
MCKYYMSLSHLTARARAPKITFVNRKLYRSDLARTVAGFAALATLLVFSVGCSDAPLISRQANRLVLSELFSTTE